MFIQTDTVLHSTILDAVPGVSHAFSTRHGGVSTLPHTASLNLTRNLGDDDAVVEKNLDIFSRIVSQNRHDRTRAVTTHQIHSAKVRVIDKTNAGEGCSRESGEDCDGFVTDTPGVIPIIRAADCVPILLAGLKRDGSPVVSAVHAGWRGTVNGIAAEAVRILCEQGAEIGTIRAAIGPHIGQCCFEVGEDFVTAVSDIRGSDFAHRHTIPSPHGKPGKYHADLTGMNLEILENAGLSRDSIDVSDACTMCDTALFYSHRGMNGLRGTMGGGICITI